MALFDLPLSELRTHTTGTAEPADLDDFWRATLDGARLVSTAAEFTPAATPLSLIETYDVTFPGFGGQPIRGWLHRPVGHPEPLPCVVQYIGYGGGRGLAHQNVLWAMSGFAHFVMDTRGQGSTWSVGATPDVDDGSFTYPGFMTRGVLDPDTYYYRRLYTDAVRAVDAARSHPGVDPARVAVAGGSQGGALALATAALAEDLVGAMIDVPFLCDIRRACEVTDEFPYQEVTRYLKVHRDQVDQVFSTLAYVDGAVLARRASAPALFSVAMMDVTCPPSTVYAGYNAYTGPKEIREYTFNDHEGGGPFHEVTQVDWLHTILAGKAA
jgi:cephalosporin-C deacetylase